ncbi:WhiB family transcriptional regulator [Kitasatospora sp. NPDC058478]|uniref:WhiB family transcriptional regulator n=1 Tax=unclassified Kitasatospora TaxID=2633591 RepID=UPI00365E386D
MTKQLSQKAEISIKRGAAHTALTQEPGYNWRPCQPNFDPDTIDPQWWVSETAAEIIRAKAVCRDLCPVMDACARYAIDHNEQGVWGGLDDRDRQTLRRARQRQAKKDPAAEPTEPLPLDTNVIRTPFQERLIDALRTANGDLRAAAALVPVSYSTACSMYKAIAYRARVHDAFYEKASELLERIDQLNGVVRENLARAA